MRRRRKGIPEGQRTFIGNAIESNDNVTVPIGPVTLSLMTVKTLGLPELLDLLKRRQRTSVINATVVSMAHAMQMRGLSINRMEDIPDDPNRLKIYRLDDGVDKNDLHRIGRILGKNIDKVVEYMERQLETDFLRYVVVIKIATGHHSAAILTITTYCRKLVIITVSFIRQH